MTVNPLELTNCDAQPVYEPESFKLQNFFSSVLSLRAVPSYVIMTSKAFIPPNDIKVMKRGPCTKIAEIVAKKIHSKY
jgi:hypothetical protein